jgi:hypothetical protein
VPVLLPLLFLLPLLPLNDERLLLLLELPDTLPVFDEVLDVGRVYCSLRVFVIVDGFEYLSEPDTWRLVPVEVVLSALEDTLPVVDVPLSLLVVDTLPPVDDVPLSLLVVDTLPPVDDVPLSLLVVGTLPPVDEPVVLRPDSVDER